MYRPRPDLQCMVSPGAIDATMLSACPLTASSNFKDGPTHKAISDIAVTRALPDVTVVVPVDAAEAAARVAIVAEQDGR